MNNLKNNPEFLINEICNLIRSSGLDLYSTSPQRMGEQTIIKLRYVNIFSDAIVKLSDPYFDILIWEEED